MEISYSRSGDYLIPNIAMDSQSQGNIGKFGRLRKIGQRQLISADHGSLIRNEHSGDDF